MCVCLLVTFVSHAKTAKPIKVPFLGRGDSGWPKNHGLDGVDQIPKGKGQFLGAGCPAH